MDEFLSKPIETAALWAAVDRLASRRPPAAYAPRRSEPGLLDRRAILRTCGGDGAVLEKLRDVFRRTLPPRIPLVRAALTKRDFERLREGP
jgi:hypothetical protein